MAEALARQGLLSSHWPRTFHSLRERRDLPSFSVPPPPVSRRGDRSSPCRIKFHGRKLVIRPPRGLPSPGNAGFCSTQTTLPSKKAVNWWEKEMQPNMREIKSAEDLVSSLLNAGDKLVVVDFFSPSCGGCRSLHPKIGQFAQLNPDVLFLQINYEKHLSMCRSLSVCVLPFFRFYRGAEGNLCSFSCTNATIHRFKKALAKHTTERCSLGPTRGLGDSELLALAANAELCFEYTGNPVPVPDDTPASRDDLPVPANPGLAQESQVKALATAEA